ncbi:hypothetical protein Back2_19400 [Nocardioides baekrokdamisoli]|uniref:ESAT-6-like protein n=1 Tax=Nocardioides baekrokdamisoli TaxID=1804624 RepID=A0A3G9IZ38_9ACTN|nr:hypothetical protein [Nocardioides baekrokdamisoli]BBH17653.1 hypothetical protein Back2_19400 [Nocardioides baekrokdamisoli]
MYATITDLRDRARALEDSADRLAHRVGTIAWQGTAADAMRRRAGTAIAELRRCARLHDDAAAVLERHHQAALMNPVGHMADEAVGAVDGLASLVGGLL